MTDQAPPPNDDEQEENEVLRAARERRQQQEAADAAEAAPSSVSLLKIPDEFIGQELRDNIQDAHVSLEEYIRTFKLGNIKHKNRVFNMTVAPAPTVPPEDVVAMTKTSLFQ